MAINYCIACSNPDAILIEELKFLVSFNFNEFACNHLGRAGNRAAHAFGCFRLLVHQKGGAYHKFHSG
jgi:hypothetical protein